MQGLSKLLCSHFSQVIQVNIDRCVALQPFQAKSNVKDQEMIQIISIAEMSRMMRLMAMTYAAKTRKGRSQPAQCFLSCSA